MSLDPAILEVLGLPPEQCKVSQKGSTGFASSFKITTEDNDDAHHYFVKTGNDAEMFQGEHASLNAIHDAVPDFCPRSLAQGPLQNSKSSFLLTDFIDFGSASGKDTEKTVPFSQKLARMHSSITPKLGEHGKPMFGFPITTCCGSTPQPNGWKTSWVDFFSENRLRFILDRAEANEGVDKALRTKMEKIISTVVPRLLRDGHLGGATGIEPVLVHGDLWSGNKSQGIIGGKGPVQDVVYDPSSCYAHSEYELGIMRMFGGFSSSFFHEYHKHIPKTDPADEYGDRVQLYQL